MDSIHWTELHSCISINKENLGWQFISNIVCTPAYSNDWGEGGREVEPQTNFSKGRVWQGLNF